MPCETTQPGPARADRIELILQELEALLTLGAVAVRVLEVTADDEADAREVIRLVESDPALASRVLAMCRCHERGRAADVSTVERAVLMLGFEAIRCAVLSIQVFELFDALGSPGGERRSARTVFDREAFWLHALAVAVASERIAARGTLTGSVPPGEAFIAGLLHDLGHLVLHLLLPESFDQVCRVAETHSASLDHACRKIIGIDTHTAGKRLAESWDLPPSLVDVIWLSGQPYEALPPGPHRELISVVSLADAVVRTRYVNSGADWSLTDDLVAQSVPVGVTAADLDAIADGLHEAVGDRAGALGMSETHDPSVLLRMIARANASLARANVGMRQRERTARRQAQVLEALIDFHRTRSGRTSVADALERIARSLAGVLDAAVVAALHPSIDGQSWRLVRFGTGYRPYGNRPVQTPLSAVSLESLVADVHDLMPVTVLMPWIAEALEEPMDAQRMRLLVVRGGEGANAILLFDPAREPDLAGEMEGLVESWRAALAAGCEHDRGAQLAEQLAEANRSLGDAQEALARSRTMSTLGEVAAGAAHEMNNPLTVISGRSQILANRLQDPEPREMAEEIFAQSHRLSDMITALRSFAEPVAPQKQWVDVADLVVRVVQGIGGPERGSIRISTVLGAGVPDVLGDPDLLGAALGELVRNATESKGADHIELRVQTEALDGRLRIEVRDDGEGLSDHALKHAFDPFFSDRPAGRQPGLGLARVRRTVEAHGGRITLVNGPGGGAVATIWLKDWRQEDDGSTGARAEPETTDDEG